MKNKKKQPAAPTGWDIFDETKKDADQKKIKKSKSKKEKVLPSVPAGEVEPVPARKKEPAQATQSPFNLLGAAVSDSSTTKETKKPVSFLAAELAWNWDEHEDALDDALDNALKAPGPSRKATAANKKVDANVNPRMQSLAAPPTANATVGDNVNPFMRSQAACPTGACPLVRDEGRWDHLRPAGKDARSGAPQVYSLVDVVEILRPLPYDDDDNNNHSAALGAGIDPGRNVREKLLAASKKKMKSYIDMGQTSVAMKKEASVSPGDKVGGVPVNTSDKIAAASGTAEETVKMTGGETDDVTGNKIGKVFGDTIRPADLLAEGVTTGSDIDVKPLKKNEQSEVNKKDE